MNLLNVYHRDASNAGDLASSPFKYFSFNCITAEFGAAKHEPVPKADAVIVGGGGLISNPTFKNVIEAALQSILGPKVLWGAGFNLRSYPFRFSRDLDGLPGLKAEVRGFLKRYGLKDKSSWQKSLLKQSQHYPTIDSRYNLVGVRDWGTNYRWVPCASCMHPIFDAARLQSPRKKLVVIDHPMFFKINTSRPIKSSNLDKSFENIISILAESEVVLTSSYHAAYWAILLGRRVVVVPWSTKFLRFRWPIEFAFDLDGVSNAIKTSKTFPNALDESRNANIAFARDVSRLINVSVDW